MVLDPAEVEERIVALEERDLKLLRLIRQSRAFTGNPLAVSTDLDDLGSVKTHLDFEEAPLTPVTPLADVGRMFSKDEDGQTMPYWISEDGNTHGMVPKFRSRATRNSTQLISTATFTVIGYDDEDYDPFGDYDNVTDFDYTVPVAGRYLVTAAVGMTLTAAGSDLFCSIFINGAEKSRGVRFATHASDDVAAMVTDVLDLVATNTIDIRVFHTRGADQNISADASLNYFAVHALSL